VKAAYPNQPQDGPDVSIIVMVFLNVSTDNAVALVGSGLFPFFPNNVSNFLLILVALAMFVTSDLFLLSEFLW
jgi:hypothetical protein